MGQYQKLIKKPFIAISFGSDIRNQNKSKFISLFNLISAPVIDQLIVIGPELVDIAKRRKYRKVDYVGSWAGAIT